MFDQRCSIVRLFSALPFPARFHTGDGLEQFSLLLFLSLFLFLFLVMDSSNLM